jgi:radical SAM superfamily enzyme YgiQ (UPF0313 family)
MHPTARPRLYLINPINPLVSIINVKENYWNQYRVWKPLSLMVLAGLTPREWDITIFDENVRLQDYASLPRPDLVGITAFTSQANRAYEVAAEFRARGVPVVLGGIHATMRLDEARARADSVVIGEAEAVWGELLEDLRKGALKPTYTGTYADMDRVPPARHDLLPTGYRFGSIQLSRGCPLNCSFCSVSQFNGKRYRCRPVEACVEEFRLIREKLVLVVDDNLIGTSRQHLEHAKTLFRAMAKANLGKKWMGQATINMADDDELLDLARQAGCFGVFIGFESPTAEGLDEIGKKFNLQKNRVMADAVKKIQSHGIMVAGSFVLGLDVDKKGIGRRIAEAGNAFGVDLLNVLFMTPLPGTRLWDKMEEDGRLVANHFPDDWKYYTLTFPVATYAQLSWSEMLQEMNDTNEYFYSYKHIARRALTSMWRSRGLFGPFVTLATNFSFKFNGTIDNNTYKGVDLARGQALIDRELTEVRASEAPAEAAWTS